MNPVSPIRMLFALSVAWVGCAGALGDTIALLDGKTVTNQSIAAIADGEVTYGDQTFDLMNMRRVERKTKSLPTDAQRGVIMLHDGSSARVKQLSVNEEVCRIILVDDAEMDFPLSSLRLVMFKAVESRPRGFVWPKEVADALARPRTGDDLLMVYKQEKVTSIPGVLKAVDDTHVTFIYKGKDRTVAREKVLAVILAASAQPPDTAGMGLIHTAQGLSLWGKALRLETDRLHLQRSDGQTLWLPWSKVRRIDIRSDRMAWLSELEPVEVDDTPMFTLGGWERDRSWLGRPITLKGKTYERGLGVHAPCRLVYEPAGRYQTFAAVIGIDDETHQQGGDCIFVVIGDGRMIYRQRVTSRDKPRPLRLDITGVQRLELRVEPGENLDIGDHADWADARLIRDTPRRTLNRKNR